MSHACGFYRQLWWGRTPLRALMNEALARTGTWNGSILDIGGTRKPLPSYHDYLRRGAESSVTCVNIDAQAEPDLIGDAQAMPVADSSYDQAWCLNLLEHVPDPLAVLKETMRALRPGGRVVVFTPFFTRIHGHPFDFYRYTDTALKRYAEMAGFLIEHVEVIGGGPFLTVAAQLQLFMPSFVFVPFAACARGLDRVFAWRWRILGRAWPLGYLLILKKPS